MSPLGGVRRVIREEKTALVLTKMPSLFARKASKEFPIVLSEYDIYLYAASCGWTATLDFLHAGEYIQGVFLSRGAKTTLLGPLGAVQQMTAEQFFACLEPLEAYQQASDQTPAKKR